VNHYLPYFRQQLIICLLSAGYFCSLCLLKVHAESSSLPLPDSPVERVAGWLFLQALFTESSCRDQLLSPSSFSGALKAPHPLCCMCPFKFLVYYSVVFVGWEPVCPGGSAGLSQGWLWEYCMLLIFIPIGLHLPSRFGAGIWWHRSPPVFSV
jgi:hypothetical protein